VSRLLSLLLLLELLAPSTTAYAQTDCDFKLGFAALRVLAGADLVGDCLEDEHANPRNGDALQRTTRGLLVWRKLDNFTAFTDGERTWVNGPFGVQQRRNTERFDWEAIATPEPAVVGAAPGPPVPVLVSDGRGPCLGMPGALRLVWRYDGTLSDDEWFDVLFWGQGRSALSIANTKETCFALNEQELYTNTFNWTIALISKRGDRTVTLRRAANVRRFAWTRVPDICWDPASRTEYFPPCRWP
jgi:hypothetical protein